MAKSKRRPPFGATKKTAIGYSRERAFKNRIHELEQEVLKIANDRQRVVENNVKLADDLRIAREATDTAREEAEHERLSMRAAMGVSFSRGDLNAAKDDVLRVAEGIVEAFARGLATGKVER